MADSTTITINENLIKFDSLLTGLNYLFEEIQSRKEQIIEAVNIDEKIYTRMNSNDFQQGLVDLIQSNYGEGIYREVAFIVMEKIDNDIEAFINARVDERLRQRGITISEVSPSGS